MVDERITFFHKPEEDNGYLSNLYPSPFTYLDNSFENAEQYLGYMKARVSNDEDTEEQVMQTHEPRLARKLRRKMEMETPTVDLWTEIRQEVMRWGVRQKFLQNPDLLDRLLSTNYALLAEATDSNTVWGIGLPMEDYKKFKPGNWKGQNLMGEVLMDVRRELRTWEKVHDDDVLESPIGNMRLAEVVRLPGARKPMNVYAAIAMNANPGVFKDKDDFYYQCGKLGDLKEAMDSNAENLLPQEGFHEMLFELNSKYQHGKL